MLNIIKMDFYRMFKSVSFWVSLIVASGIAVFVNIMAVLFEISDMFTKSASFILMQALSGGDTLIICTIFISLFIHSEFKNGFIKNIAGHVKPRGKLILSKLLILVGYIIILPLTYYLFSILTLTLSGSKIIFDFSADIFMAIAVEMLLYFAFGSIIIMLSIISNSNALSIAVGIMMSTQVFSIIFVVIDYLIRKINPDSTFTSSDYSLISNIGNVATINYSANTDENYIVRAVCVGIVFAAVAITLSVFSLQKKDIK